MTDREREWFIPATCDSPRFQILLGYKDAEWRDVACVPSLRYGTMLWDEARQDWQEYMADRVHPARMLEVLGGVQ